MHHPSSNALSLTPGLLLDKTKATSGVDSYLSNVEQNNLKKVYSVETPATENPKLKSESNLFGTLVFLSFDIVSSFGFRSFGFAQDMVSNL
jgi:hypothetical protein